MLVDADAVLWCLAALDTDAIVERTRARVAQERTLEQSAPGAAEQAAYWHGVRVGAAIVRGALLSFVQDQAGPARDDVIQ